MTVCQVLTGVENPTCLTLGQKNVEECVQRLEGRGWQAGGLVCHVGQKEHRQRLIDYTVQVPIPPPLPQPSIIPECLPGGNEQTREIAHNQSPVEACEP